MFYVGSSDEEAEEPPRRTPSTSRVGFYIGSDEEEVDQTFAAAAEPQQSSWERPIDWDEPLDYAASLDLGSLPSKATSHPSPGLTRRPVTDWDEPLDYAASLDLGSLPSVDRRSKSKSESPRKLTKWGAVEDLAAMSSGKPNMDWDEPLDYEASLDLGSLPTPPPGQLRRTKFVGDLAAAGGSDVSDLDDFALMEQMVNEGDVEVSRTPPMSFSRTQPSLPMLSPVRMRRVLGRWIPADPVISLSQAGSTRGRVFSTVSQVTQAMNDELRSLTKVFGFIEPHTDDDRVLTNIYLAKLPKAFGFQSTGRFLGRGGFGEVVETIRIRDNRKAACKQQFMNPAHISMTQDGRLFLNEAALNDTKPFRREILILSLLQGHPHIIELLGHGIINYRMFIFLELATTDLTHLINSVPDLKEDVAADWFGQIVSGIHHMHYKGVSNNDIKPDNVLAFSQPGWGRYGFEFGNWLLKITDFGLASVATDRQYGHLPRANGCGSMPFMSPECLLNMALDVLERFEEKKEYYPYPSDVWSLGVTLAVMLCKSYPYQFPSKSTGHPDGFYGMKSTYLLALDVVEAMVRGDFYIPDFYGMSNELQDFFKNIFQADPNKRMTLRCLMSHPFMANHPEIGFRVKTNYKPPLRPYRLMRLPSIRSFAPDIRSRWRWRLRWPGLV